MFGFLRSNPVAKLEKQYRKKLEEARDALREGDVVRNANLTTEAEEIARKIDEAKAANAGS